MKRYLLFVIAFVCVSIGTQIHAAATIGTTTWAQYSSYADMENVLTIYVSDPGDLATAIADQDFSNVQILHISARDRSSSLLALSPEDIAALSSVNVKTIEMMRAYVEPFTLTNSNVERIILPYNWTKAQVKAVGEANSTSTKFECCISTNDQDAYESRTGNAALIAYLSKPNTLKDAIMRTWNDTHNYAPLGSQVHQGGGDCSRLKYLTVMGNICARDISRQGFYDENGHYETRGIPDENSTTFNINTAGQAYYIGFNGRDAVSGATPGALEANTGDLYYLDLRDASLPDEYAADIVFPYSQMGGTNLKEIWMPQDPGFKTIPADYLNIASNYIHQICIPSNIQYIKTRAFAGTPINYIWTTGTDANTRYDNGAYFVSGEGDNETITHKYKDNPDQTDPENVDWADGDDNNFTYGTMTLPAGLKLIERHAFYSSNKVRDLYVLATTAPECHVDAFNEVMYHANNSLTSSSIKEEDGAKIVTRDAYSMSNYEMMTMLHYPRTCGTPQTQRYTDPSREYNIATGERDGNGNMLYFPTHTEFAVAHDQGTYGYLWNGWKIERTWYNNEITLGGVQGYYGTLSASGHTKSGQQAANDFYINNDFTDPDKTVNSFYDVTIGENNQPGLVNKPAGLKDYWTNYRNGKQLYPQAKYETSSYVYVLDINGDYVKDPSSTCNTVFRAYAGSADDQLERYSRKQVIGYYSCSDGRFVQDYTWTKDDGGLYVLDGEYTMNTTGGGHYVLDYTWVRDDANGTHYHPLVSTAFPGDEWGNLPNDFNAYADYWYATYRYDKDPNGEYVKVYEEYYTDTTVPSWFASVYEQQKAAGETYIRTLKGYIQCANNEEVKNHKAELFVVGDTYALWTSDVKDFVNGQKFARNPIAGEYRDYNPSTDEGCDRYDITGNGFVLAVSPDDDSKQHYTKNYVANSYREFDEDVDKVGEPLYCYGECDYVSSTPITYSIQNDYRGWHQFVLTGVAHNSKIPFEPLRSFITDNDWWTICEPYDLRYSDMKKFFGTDRYGFGAKIPYLSKLMYVIRDVEHQTITLMFSKNLMEYKEQFRAEDTKEGGSLAERVHGYIEDSEEGKWTPEELAEDPIILHAGVPYLIRPNLTVDATTGKIDGVRQFDIMKNEPGDLYDRLHEALTLSAGKQFDMIYDGEYTVPAYVVGESTTVTENTTDTKEITMKDGTKFTYTSEGKKIRYHGQDVPYRISEDFTYTFVGTFYKSAMPQYCYFLGWDSKNNRAAFWYSRTVDQDGWNWNNQTGIICPNFDTDLTIHQATKLDDPARWQFNPSNKVDKVEDFVKCDDFKVGTTASNAKQYTMGYGADMNLASVDEDPLAEDYGNQEVLSIDEIQSLDVKGEWYNVNGQKLSGRPTQSGVYIMGNKKYVVK